MNKIHTLINNLKEHKLTLAIAESMTCGMATNTLASVKGISDVLKGSIVCYTPEVKMELLGIKKSMIDKYSCESMEITEALVHQLSKLITADIYASITGLASPGGSETKQKPVGTVFFCIKYKSKIYKQKKVYKGTPVEIRKFAAKELFNFMNKFIFLQ